MMPQANSRNGIRQKHSLYLWLPILLAVVALTVSVATRTTVVSVSHGISVSENTSGVIRQHMDSDGVGWVPPVTTQLFAELVISHYPRIAPAGPPPPDLLFEDALYNRPPPTC
ncbi:MAG TPA: hypothetical protein VLK33_12745 [Terriglobales bacterium]|nr:hypothetical protein [Terriglobales bacterium]